MRTLYSCSFRLALLLAGLALCWAGGARADAVATPRTATPVLLFDLVLDAPPADGGPDAPALARLAAESFQRALQASGFTYTNFNPDGPTVVRASREHKLATEDLVHPELGPAARKIALVYGARYALFPRLLELVVDTEKGQSRAVLTARVVPDVGEEREIRGEGSGRGKVEKKNRGAIERLVKQAVDAAARVAAQELAGPGGEATPDAHMPEAQSYYLEAIQRQKENRMDLVIPLLERATILDPRCIEYALALGDAYQRAGQSASALMEYRRAVTIQPGSVDLRVKLAGIYLQRSMVREASAELKRAAGIDPASDKVHAALMDVYLRGGMVEEALAEAKRVAAARPNDPAIHVSLGDLLLRRGRADDAEAEYKKAVALDPADPAPHQKLAALYRQKNQHREALQELIAAQRTPAGADDAQRYRDIAEAIDAEALRVLSEATRVLGERKAQTITREDAYAAVKTLAGRADALTAEVTTLKAPAVFDESHRARVFALSLLTQSLVAYQSYYENDGPDDATAADLLQVQANKEMQRARELMKK